MNKFQERISGYVETSAKNATNVDQIFEQASQAILKDLNRTNQTSTRIATGTPLPAEPVPRARQEGPSVLYNFYLAVMNNLPTKLKGIGALLIIGGLIVGGMGITSNDTILTLAGTALTSFGAGAFCGGFFAFKLSEASSNNYHTIPPTRV